jgi:hypothetical protein
MPLPAYAPFYSVKVRGAFFVRTMTGNYLRSIKVSDNTALVEHPHRVVKKGFNRYQSVIIRSNN